MVGAMARGRVDEWIAHLREVVNRLPKWLAGTTLVCSASLAVWCVVYDHGLMPLLRRLYPERPEVAVMGTVAFTVWPFLLALYVIGRITKPKPPSNLPGARVRE